MKYLVLFSFFFCFTYSPMCAQKYEYPSLRLGFTPSALANYYPAIQFSLDKSLSKRFNFVLESGFVFNSTFGAKGFRVRPGVDWLMTRREKAGLAFGIHINYRWTTEYRTLFRRDPSGEFTRIFYNEKRKRHYLSPMGSLTYIYQPSKRWALEFGFGGGLALYEIQEERASQLGDRFGEENDLFLLDESLDLFVATNFHLNFSYILTE